MLDARPFNSGCGDPVTEKSIGKAACEEYIHALARLEFYPWLTLARLAPRRPHTSIVMVYPARLRLCRASLFNVGAKDRLHTSQPVDLAGESLASAHAQAGNRQAARSPCSPSASTPERLRQALLRAALQHDGCLSVTQGVSATGQAFADVERVLNEMVTSGYIYKRNNPQTGVIEYVFKEVL